MATNVLKKKFYSGLKKKISSIQSNEASNLITRITPRDQHRPITKFDLSQKQNNSLVADLVLIEANKLAVVNRVLKNKLSVWLFIIY